MNLLDLLFPPRCVACGKIGKYLCSKCSLLIRIIRLNEQVCPVCERPAIDGETHPYCKDRYSLDGLTSFFVYEGPIRKAIKLLKYRFVTDLANEIVLKAFALPLSEAKGFSKATPYEANVVLTSVPLHWRRYNWRGFNQAEVLGKLMAQKLGIKFLPDLLVRKKHTEPQVKLKSKERKENIKDAFAINSKQCFLLSTHYFLLFDDVWTTGSTLRACAKVLKQAGAKKVWGMTLAR